MSNTTPPDPIPSKRRRVKKTISGMLPVKKWLSLPESCAYMDMSQNHFIKLAVDRNLTISTIGNKKYFKTEQLDMLLEQNIILNK
jgi:hypothetical protein